MARLWAAPRRALETSFLLLVSCMIFGNGLHFEFLGGRNDQLLNAKHLIRHKRGWSGRPVLDCDEEDNSRMNPAARNLGGNARYPIRQKREWIVPPVGICEEEDNTKRNPIARIQSDQAANHPFTITYKITGPGVTEPPYGLFSMNETTGELKVHNVRVDREQTSEFILKGYAKDRYGNDLEKPVALPVYVFDKNDNSPVFSMEVFQGSIEELCDVGSLVMKIDATDADDPTSPNSKIAFRIISQEPSQPSAFQIDRETGEVWTSTYQLDREEQSSYTLTVEAKDQGKNAVSQQTTVQIKVLDVNDNIPVFGKTMYEGSIKENTANVEIMRLKILDRDEEFTDNWLAKFTIVKGNEGGYFKIETDSHTNEGILTLVKEVNYEELQNMDLSIVVSNKAAYHKSIVSHGFQETPVIVKIKVENEIEGFTFKPQTMVIKTSETMKVNQILGRFPAYDEDTGKTAERVRYAKVRDDENWFIIDSKTAEIKLIKVPDFESRSVVNGTYVATIVAITEDYPAKTATGTILIEVENVNDHCPTLTSPERTICADEKYINITAEDWDAHPYGGPFTYTILDGPERMSDTWVIGQADGVRAQLVPQNVKPGVYDVPVLVRDNQGLSCPEQQTLKLTVCTCGSGTRACQEKSSAVALGPGAIALIILALLLLLLLPLLLLLLLCRSGGGAAKGFAAIPDTSIDSLRNWNSEGAAPEDKAILTGGSVLTSAANLGSGVASSDRVGVGSSEIKNHYNQVNTIDRRWEEQTALLSGAEFGRGLDMAARRRRVTQDTGGMIATETGGAMNEEFLRSYFSEKADAFADEDESHLAKDCLLVYSQEEERGSPPGSVGCCSFIEGDFDDTFLDDLGDKFKTLAEICMGKQMGTEAGKLNSQILKDRSATPTVNESDGHYLHQQNALNSEYTFQPVKSFGTETVTQETVTETSLTSRPGLQPVKPIPNPLFNSSVVVTEASYGAAPPAIILDPQFNENVVVTERVLAPASGLQGVLEMPTGVFQDVPDSKYVVVRERERVLVPSSDLKASLSIPNLSEGQNVVVTERVVTPVAGLQATAIRSTTEPYTASNKQEHILISDPLLNKGSTAEALASGPTLSKSSKVTKYSSVHYTRS